MFAYLDFFWFSVFIPILFSFPMTSFIFKPVYADITQYNFCFKSVYFFFLIGSPVEKQKMSLINKSIGFCVLYFITFKITLKYLIVEPRDSESLVA